MGEEAWSVKIAAKYSDRLMTYLKIKHLNAQKCKCCERIIKIRTNV